MPEIDELLINYLENLSLSDWQKQTLAPKWKVKDVAVHLLDGNLRTLSMLRDKHYGEKAESINSYKDLVNFLNQLNADWIKAAKRLSPKVVIELLRLSGREYCDFLNTLDLNEKAEFSVEWAGENESKNWFHIAREYTEKWHHQQQIRLATGYDKTLLQDRFYEPYLDTSIRALPYHYSKVISQEGNSIKFTFKGDTDKTWFLRYSNRWELFKKIDHKPNSEVIIKDEFAWRIFTKGIQKEEAIQNSIILGDKEIGVKIFDMIAVMA